MVYWLFQSFIHLNLLMNFSRCQYLRHFQLKIWWFSFHLIENVECCIMLKNKRIAQNHCQNTREKGTNVTNSERKFNAGKHATFWSCKQCQFDCNPQALLNIKAISYLLSGLLISTYIEMQGFRVCKILHWYPTQTELLTRFDSAMWKAWVFIRLASSRNTTSCLIFGIEFMNDAMHAIIEWP